VVHKSTALVHVSGHAPAGELRYLLNAVRPRNHMPIHGEWRHLRAHAAIARSTGIPDERIMLAPDGSVVDLVDGLATIVGEVPVGYVYVDGLAVGDIGDAVLQDRRILGEEGFLTILVAVDFQAGKVIFGPEHTVRRLVGRWVDRTYRRRPMLIPMVVEV
jgi:ribonuclease J